MIIVEMIRIIEMVNCVITSNFLRGELVDPVDESGFMIFIGENDDK